MSHEGKHSMPIKQSYNAHIKESREHETYELLAEFIDDYTYEQNNFVCIHIGRNAKKDGIFLYLSMEKGPQTPESMSRILQWRISGLSNEKGHKGGGNKRLIYGHDATRVILQSMVNTEEFIKAETKPDDIFALSNNEPISESDFINKVDRENIKWPTDVLNLDEEGGGWFNKYRTDMKNANLPVNYVMRFTLSTLNREEYIDRKHWSLLITSIRMKNYNIPIHYKNEYLGDSEFTTYPNIDMIGLHHKHDEQIMELYLSESDECIIKNKNLYINSKGEEIVFDASFKKFGNISAYKINEGYLKEQLYMLNEIIRPVRQYTQESFFGAYVFLNGKQTNYLPISDIMPLSKGLGPLLGNSLFRIVIEPTCMDPILEKLIITPTIKAKTHFKNISQAKKLTNEIIKIARRNIYPEEVKVAKKKKTSDNIPGQCYVIHLGADLYKYGYVTGEEKMKKRMDQHKMESIVKVKEFCQIDMPEKYCKPIHYTTPLIKPKGFEEWIGQMLEDKEKIILYKNDGSEHEQREYFTCSDQDYIIDTILPMIIKNQQQY